MMVRSQRGQTLIELLIGITVSALVLAAIAGLFITVNDRVSQWGKKLDVATNGFGVASAIQADGHRLLPCNKTSLPNQLYFCFPLNCASPVARYDSSLSPSGTPPTYLVTRTDLTDPAKVERVVGRLPGNSTGGPNFSLSGTAVTITGIGSTPGNTMMVYLHPPSGSCS